MTRLRLSKLEKITVTLIVIIGLMFALGANRAVYKGPALLPDPVQVMLEEREILVLKTSTGDVKLELLARYIISAGVRGRKNYRGDILSSVSPMDLILAWSDLNQPTMLKSVKYSQSGRWYNYRTPSSQVSVSHVGRNSANTHIIPADEVVLGILQQIKRNHFVELEGYLVNVVLEDATLRTSLSRDDTGGGACEIFYVIGAKVHR